MGESQTNNDNDIAIYKMEYNDNDIVGDRKEFNYSKFLKEKVDCKITDYRLNCLQHYLFGNNKYISDCGAFINPAIKQIERFMYYWINELDDKTRRIIVNHRLNGFDNDFREYSEFLNTPLWKYESSIYKIQRNFTCSICGKQFQPTFLVLHHLSYEHLGSEFAHPEDVTILCIDCHKKVHNIGVGDE